MEDLRKLAKEIQEELEKRRQEIKLTFIEDKHVYFMEDVDGVVKKTFPSVSSIYKVFHSHFDADAKSLQMCKGDLVVQKELLAQWKEKGRKSTNLGSRVHFHLEQNLVEMYDDYKDLRYPIFQCDKEQVVISDKMIKAGDDYIKLMHDRGAVLLDTEIILGDPKLGYVGQPDKGWLMLNQKKELGVIITDWKGLPIDTPILTMNGWRTMGNLIKTDKVIDKDGNFVKIKHFSEVKNKKCLKIKFDNGEEIVSDFEHRWLVFVKYLGKKTEKVMTTQEIKDYYNNLEKRLPHKILKIENPKPFNLSKRTLPIDPYVFGVWLGDGHSACGMITQANQRVWDEIINRGYVLGSDVSGGGAGKAMSRTVFGLRTKLREYNLLNNKHLPDLFLLSSYEQRLDILRGLMDSDGYFNKKRKRFIISTTKECQVKFSTEITSSLGLKPTTIKYNKHFNGKIIKCFNVEFTTDNFNPFLCRNENIKIDIKKDKNTYRNIVSVEDVESVPTRCIEVDSPTSTFLCGRTLLVTHNTNQPKNFVKQWYTDKMYFPFEKYWNTDLSHYYVQSPLYGRLVVEMLQNSKFKDIKLFGGCVVLLKENGTFEEYKIPQDVVDKVMNLNIKEYV